MKLNEIILLMIDGLGGTLGGKTKIQKLCYFYSVLNGKEMGFRPHHYGPYSPAVENAMDELEGIGLIDKKVENYGENSDGFAINRYDYLITKYGDQVIETIGDSEEKRHLDEFIKKIKRFGLPTTIDISIAAKSHFILEREKGPLNSGEIRRKAEAFGWDIKPDSIEKAANFLRGMGVLDVGRNA